MVFVECGGYTFNDGFDSGNLGRVELVKRYTDDVLPGEVPASAEQPANVEVNVWTRPDCEGTPYENTNRTWYYFSVKGGRPSHVLRFNVMNLNRQAKLYSQGMHPVVKIGASGKWERTKDRPSYRIDEQNFVMSFIHRGGEDTSVEFYYAFTFPYTYRELQEYLGRLDRRFRKRMLEIKRRGLEDNVNTFVEEADIAGMGESKSGLVDGCPSSAAETESNPDSSADDLYNEIYYYRELLTQSVERRRIDLLTITSYHGICADREERLEDLFPERARHRCHTFRNKQIVFLSSRVHPGETPASFVLNGFLRLLLDRKSQIAATLRRKFVFKIVPFLNPDGVSNGLYRSDTLGHNLNRVYTSPDPEIHPSIYAVRKLLRFYHYGVDKSETMEALPSKENTSSDAESGEIETMSEEFKVVSLKDLIMNQLNKQIQLEETEPNSPNWPMDREGAGPKGVENDENCTPPAVLIEELKDALSLDGLESDNRSLSGCSSRTPLSSKTEDSSRPKAAAPAGKLMQKDLPANRIGIAKGSATKEGATSSGGGPKKVFKSKSGGEKPPIHSARYRASERNKPFDSSVGSSSTGIDFHNLYAQFEGEEAAEGEEKTNLFLYIDLHGHASKKGVFMYGNHLAHPMQAVECMLLPRLMSMNCHHFHFDACNFSERNMYHKGKRDGLSKEGSGRVAVYKSTGLIKSYTLECNYNTGKYVNVLPPRGKDKTTKAVNLVPPKYTPAHFEEVGRALGASILDLINANPVSRLPNSEFRTLQGLRNALRLEIEKTFTKNQLLLKAAKGKLKRLKSVMSFAKAGPSSAAQLGGSKTGCDSEVFKENKLYWDGVAAAGRTAGGLRNVTNTSGRAGGQTTSSLSQRSNARSLPGRVGTSSSSTMYGKKETGARKKGKVLCDSKMPPQDHGHKKEAVPLLGALNPVKRLKVNQSFPKGEADDLSTNPSSDESRGTMISEEAGCSSTKVFSKRPSGIPIFKRPPASVSLASTTSSGLSSISYAGPSTSKAGSSGMPNLKISSSAAGATMRKKVDVGTAGSMIKLKKKRSLKPDPPSIKRKKSRVKTVWH